MYMRYLACIILIGSLVSDSLLMSDKKANRNEWKLVFNDEFNQKDYSQPDSTKWIRCIRYNAGWNRWISNSKDVVYIKNGQLVCRAFPNSIELDDTATMLTGAIETRGKYDFQYGKVEIRMKTNTMRGNFPAAWMKPTKTDPNRYGEIDIVEMFGDQGVAHQTIHNHQTQVLKKGKPISANRNITVDEWHVYGLEWTPGKLVMTIDGRVTGVFFKSSDDRELSEGQWTFDRPFYLILNQSVGDYGMNEFLRPDVRHVYETHFDWIRVYQKLP